jgi:hypothetical protein
LSRNFETKNTLKDTVNNIHLKKSRHIYKMQEPHRRKTFMHVQLFQIKATHLLEMVVNILDYIQHNIHLQATQLIGVLKKDV